MSIFKIIRKAARRFVVKPVHVIIADFEKAKGKLQARIDHLDEEYHATYLAITALNVQQRANAEESNRAHRVIDNISRLID